jgi:hypothetical protein
MIDWKKLVPDEPFISDVEFFPSRPPKGTPPAVKNWCMITIIVNVLIAASAAAVLHHAWPLLLGVVFILFPLYMLFFWGDVVSWVASTHKRIHEAPFVPAVKLGAQWLALSVCLGCTLMLCIIGAVLWSTQTPR